MLHPKTCLLLRSWTLACLGLATTAVSAASLASDYSAQPGDSIQISVAGMPELTQRAIVQQNGAISAPLLGELMVSGLTPTELQARVEAGLANKIYRRWTPEGREIDIVLRPEEVSASIVDYQPIYVSGDVARPGAAQFRPALTVQAAIALAGGYETAGRRVPDLLLQATQIRGDRAVTWLEFAKAQAKVSRIASELAGRQTIEPASDEAPLPAEQKQGIAKLEAETLSANMAAYQHETTSLQAAVRQVDDQIAIVTKLQQQDAQGAAADQQDLQKALDLFRRGMLTSAGINEARRALLFSSTNTLQATTQLLNLQRARQEAAENLARYIDQRRISLLKELQDATTALNEARMKAINAGQRLQDVAASQSQLAADEARRPKISIIRMGANGPAAMAADLNTALKPGDLVQVALAPADGLVSGLASR